MTSDAFDLFLQRVYKTTGAGSQSELADLLGVNRSAITQARRKGAVPAKWLLQLFRSHGIHPDWAETGKGPAFIDRAPHPPASLVQIPKVKARLCAGDGSFEVGEDIAGYYAFQGAWLHAKGALDHMVLMDIFGNSMAPEMKDGDTVLIDQSQKDILSGAVYAVGVEDTIMVKRVEKHPTALVLRSDNKDYAPIYLQQQEAAGIRMIGKVIWICRELR